MATNAADWAMLPPAIPLNNLPCDWMLDNATNYVFKLRAGIPCDTHVNPA